VTLQPAAPAEQRVFDDAEALARATADWISGLARESKGRFAVCLSGGRTPRRLFEILAGPDIAPQFPWGRVEWFWSDERFVPHNDPASNYGMARDAMFSRAPVPAGNVHPVPTEGLSPAEAASEYEAVLRRFYGGGTLDPRRPFFDVALLGIGEDGHTASLFPGNSALDETTRWVAPVTAAAGTRITLTFPALNSSRDLVFLAAGAGKREIVRRARAGDRALPAARVQPVGRLHWFADREAIEG
jgi:6-phosphogluconolactonase